VRCKDQDELGAVAIVKFIWIAGERPRGSRPDRGPPSPTQKTCNDSYSHHTWRARWDSLASFCTRSIQTDRHQTLNPSIRAPHPGSWLNVDHHWLACIIRGPPARNICSRACHHDADEGADAKPCFWNADV